MAPDGMLSFRPERDLLGRPLTQLRLSVTDRCNFRCPYCMPADGPELCFVAREELLSYEQLARVVRLLVGLGVSRVRLTGGEPLLRVDLDRLVRMLVAIPGLDDLSLTTNGYLLAAQAEKLRRAGLQRLNISLDSLDPQVYQRLNGRDLNVARVLDGIAAAERADFGALKLNCVVIRGVNDGSVVELARHFRGSLLAAAGSTTTVIAAKFSTSMAIDCICSIEELSLTATLTVKLFQPGVSSFGTVRVAWKEAVPPYALTPARSACGRPLTSQPTGRVVWSIVKSSTPLPRLVTVKLKVVLLPGLAVRCQPSTESDIE